jgi:NitT/TauT family transport system substrate-binding protein
MKVNSYNIINPMVCRHFFRKLSNLLGLLPVLAICFLLVAPVQAQYMHEGELILRMGDVSANKFPFILARDQGMYAKNGLNVKPMFSPGSVATINKSGIEVAPENIYDPDDKSIEFTIYIGGSGPMIARVMRTPDATPPTERVVLGTTHHVSRWRIFSGPEIKSLEDLKGKRLGFSGVGAVSHNYWLNFLEHMGWNPHTDVTLVGGTLNVDSLKEGKIDALMGPELHGTMALMNDFPMLADLGDYGFPVAGSALQVNRAWYEKNPEAARAFVKTGVEAIAFMKLNKAEAEKTMIKWYGMKTQEARDLFYTELLKMDSKPYPPYKGTKMIMQFYGGWDARTNFNPEDFYDDTIIKELDESGYIDSLYPGGKAPAQPDH